MSAAVEQLSAGWWLVTCQSCGHQWIQATDPQPGIDKHLPACIRREQMKSRRKAFQSRRKSLRTQLIHRDGRDCHYCGTVLDIQHMHVDHVQPIAAGGTDDLDNLVLACGPCNLAKGSRWNG